jgi:hypothetical protein
MQQVGRPPEGGHGLEYEYDAIGLGISYRIRLLVLMGGWA